MGQIYILTHIWHHLKFTPATIIKAKASWYMSIVTGSNTPYIHEELIPRT